jgi:integrase
MAVVMSNELYIPNPEAIAPAAQYLAGLHTDISRLAMTTSLNMLARVIVDTSSLPAHDKRRAWQMVDWRTLTPQNARVLVARVSRLTFDGKPIAPATVNKCVAALRGLFQTRFLAGDIDQNTVARALRALKSVEGSREMAGRYVETDEVERVRAVCLNLSAGVRGVMLWAMIAIAWKTGLRRAELTSLTMASVRRAKNNESLEYTLTVVGKRNRERTVYVMGTAARALAAYLDLRGERPGALFVPVDSVGRLGGLHGERRHLSMYPMFTMLRDACCEAGVASFGWHDLRRTAVSNMLSSSDVALTQRAMGHRRPETTVRYDRRPAQALRDAFASVS